MAANISTKPSTRGPKAAKAGKLAQAKAAADRAEAMVSGAPKPDVPQAFLGGDQSNERDTAPAFGANEPDVGVFLKHVNIARKDAEEEAELKLKLKNRKKVTKDHRQAAKAEGIVLTELDRAMKDADTEDVDLDAREQRYRKYMEWLGKPLGHQPALPAMSTPTDTERDQMRWYRRGDQDGRIGKARELPEGIPGPFVQDYLKGWDHGHGLIMQASPLTAAAFKPNGDLKTASDVAPLAPTDSKFLQFGPEHFHAGTTLEEANLSTILEGHKEAFWNAEIVTVVFGDLKRIIKEEGYVDDGNPETDITLAVPADTPVIVPVEAAEFS